jgi:hypothetical protein
LQLDPACADLNIVRGDALARASRWREAGEAYRQATRLRPGSVEAHGSLVYALARAHRDSDCVLALGGLIRLRPFDPEPHLLRGVLLGRLGRHIDCVQAFRWAAQLPVAPDGRRFVLGEDLLGFRSWRLLHDHHRSAQALAMPAGKHAGSPGHSVLNSPPERWKDAPRRSRRPPSRGRVLAGLGRATRIPTACLARAAVALLVSARTVRRGFWVSVATLLARRRPHLALRSLRAAVDIPLDIRIR